MEASRPFDITALINTQSNYVQDLSGIYDVTNQPDMSGLRGNLSALSSSIGNASAQMGNILSIQSSVNAILNDEQTRLNQKKTSIDNDANSQKRMIELNDSMQKKQSAYNSIYVIVIAVLVIFVIATKLNSIGLLPDFIFSAIILMTFSISGIVVYVKLRQIWKRDNLYFDKLDLKPPPNASSAENAKSISSATESGDLTQIAALSATCSGQSCCKTGTQWEARVGSCVPICTTGNIWSISGNTCITSAMCGNGNVCGNICNNGVNRITCTEGFSAMKNVEPFNGIFFIPSNR